MSGMFRLQNEKALQDLLRKSHCSVSEPRIVRGPFSVRDENNQVGNEKKGPKPTKPAPQRSQIEASMWEQIQASDLPQPKCAWTHPDGKQYVYLDDRLYQADFAWPELKVGLEVDGAPHRIKKSFAVSFERAYHLWHAGWTILHVGSAQVQNGTAMVWLTTVIERARIAAK